ncbi:MaoC family dehydratase [Pseudomonas schmalbachii]|uniref:MaoC family dehydratase n=1 Tax=Pseudomonas schmalbachii TaxID=2816993 RepID=A0ABS3TJD7_9PSED|nr:MaoC family dehydratase [Pseudomonas schmalbachii]MBO3273774.1 MaoC family dehydratase [Pseudomonas schmalbachii]
MSQFDFDTLQVGDELPPLTLAPINRTTLALFAGASGDHNPIHIDIDYAKKAGMPDVFAHGMLSMAYLGRLLTRWVDQRQLREYGVRFAAITQLGDVITCSGKVVGKDETNGTLRLELSTRNQAGELKLAGEAVVARTA